MYRTMAVMLLAIRPTLAAEDRPILGLVHNTKETSSLTFECQDAGRNGIECTFTQSSVWKKAHEKDLPEKIQQARDQFRKSPDMGMKADECASYEKALTALRGGKSDLKPEQLAPLQKMKPPERQDMIANVGAVVTY